jgi:hypothetical protein
LESPRTSNFQKEVSNFKHLKDTHYLSTGRIQQLARLKANALQQAATPLTNEEIHDIVCLPHTSKLVKTHGKQRLLFGGKEIEVKCNGESCKGKYYKPAIWEAKHHLHHLTLSSANTN